MYRYLLNFSDYKKHKTKTKEIGYLQGVGKKRNVKMEE